MGNAFAKMMGSKSKVVTPMNSVADKDSVKANGAKKG